MFNCCYFMLDYFLFRLPLGLTAMFKKLKLGRLLSSNSATLSLLLYLLIGGSAVRAIPEEDAWDKLSVIPVFVANKDNNAFLRFSPRRKIESTQRMSGYLDMAMAGLELERLKTIFGPSQC